MQFSDTFPLTQLCYLAHRHAIFIVLLLESPRYYINIALRNDTWCSISLTMIKFVPIMHCGHWNAWRARRQFDTKIHNARCIINYTRISLILIQLRVEDEYYVTVSSPMNPFKCSFWTMHSIIGNGIDIVNSGGLQYTLLEEQTWLHRLA